MESQCVTNLAGICETYAHIHCARREIERAKKRKQEIDMSQGAKGKALQRSYIVSSINFWKKLPYSVLDTSAPSIEPQLTTHIAPSAR